MSIDTGEGAGHDNTAVDNSTSGGRMSRSMFDDLTRSNGRIMILINVLVFLGTLAMALLDVASWFVTAFCVVGYSLSLYLGFTTLAHNRRLRNPDGTMYAVLMLLAPALPLIGLLIYALVS